MRWNSFSWIYICVRDSLARMPPFWPWPTLPTFVSATVCHVAWQTSSCRPNLMRRGLGTPTPGALRVLEPRVPGAGAINFHPHCHCRVRSVFTLYDVLGTQSHRKTTRSAAECHIHGRQILRKKFQRGDGVLLSSLWNEISSHG